MATDGCIIFDLNGSILSMDGGAREILDSGEENSLIALVRPHLKTVTENGSPLGIHDDPAKRRKITLTPLFNTQKEVTGILAVISPDRRSPSEEKFRALSLLGGGLAHDYNNILTVILGNIALAKTIDNVDVEVMEILNESEKAMIRAKDLTARLLLFSRTATPQKRAESVDAAFREQALACFMGSSIQCRFSFPANLAPVDIDLSLFHQGLISLLQFIKQWMNGEGTVEFTAEEADPARAEVPLSPSENYVKISIADSGPRMEGMESDMYFEPYAYTRKKGFELSLSIAFAIIRRHGGFITLSENGGRNTYAIYLPAKPRSPS
jgi:two-component system, cell cycle sensor histidine kinase and response regulator CckA